MASPKVVLVTGGNNGIGYETVKALLQSDKAYHVLLGSRSMEKAKLAIETLHKECPESTSTVEAIQVDLTSDESIEMAFKQVKASPGYIDTLINNAGMHTSLISLSLSLFHDICIFHTKLTSPMHAGATFDLEFVAGRISLRDCFTKAYNVNVAGTQVMTWTFMPLLLKSSDPRLIFVAGLSQITVASKAYFPTPPQPAGWPKKVDFETISYRCSKTALNMLMLDWNHKLKEDGVKVWGVGPGFLATDLGNVREKAKEMGGGHPSIGGRLLKSVVEGERDVDVGRLINKDGISPF